jgi:hypothetical protein
MVSLTPPEATFVSTLLAALVTFFAAETILPPEYSALAAIVVGAVVSYVAHSLGLPTPTANAGAPSTAAGPPGTPP